MIRYEFKPRPDFQKHLEEQGCLYHTIDGSPYWRDDAAYGFTSEEIDLIDDVTAELHIMCMQHVSDVIAAGDYEGYKFPNEIKELIERSFNYDRNCSVYGRFDLGYKDKQVKLFEYNADTPTSLPEASIWQWMWKEEVMPASNQFNSIHEKLVECWKTIKEVHPFVHFTCLESTRNPEDMGNVAYLMQTAVEAGINACHLDITDIGHAENSRYFLDLAEREIKACFKLYPWEWMMKDAFGWQALKLETQFIEPAWKMLLSTKALLPLLWKKYPKHPNLLEAHFEPIRAEGGQWIRKPMYGREGINICSVDLTGGMGSMVGEPLQDAYDREGYIMQERFQVATFTRKDGEVVFPVIGSWVIGGEPAGIGIREDETAITKNTSNFVPHYFV